MSRRHAARVAVVMAVMSVAAVIWGLWAIFAAGSVLLLGVSALPGVPLGTRVPLMVYGAGLGLFAIGTGQQIETLRELGLLAYALGLAATAANIMRERRDARA